MQNVHIKTDFFKVKQNRNYHYTVHEADRLNIPKEREDPMEDLELMCFRIISHVGNAKSCYIEAIHLAQDGNYEAAENKLKEGEVSFIEGHHAHANLIQKEAAGTPTMVTLLLVHAEDQLMTAETVCTLAKEFIKLHKKVNTISA